MEKLSYNQWIYIKSLRQKRQYWDKDYKDGDLSKIQASYLIKKLINMPHGAN